jgi:hypothetical protein
VKTEEERKRRKASLQNNFGKPQKKRNHAYRRKSECIYST